jgi:hypothetical protein
MGRKTNMAEKAKRLQPKGDTLRELFLKSGNLCAYPNCPRIIMNAGGVFVGEVCHIEAAEEGGERFNPATTNEERRAFANLMLMCHEHHKVTDDVTQYAVEKLREMKADHERRFAHPDRAILEKLTDWTTREEPTEVKNLKRIDAVLGWGADEEHLQRSAAELKDYIDILLAFTTNRGNLNLPVRSAFSSGGSRSPPWTARPRACGSSRPRC